MWRTGWESPRACSELALLGMLSKGCSSHELRFLLWRAVEKGKVGVDGIRLGAPSAPVVPTPRKNFGLYWCGSTTVGSASIEKWFRGVANGQDECSMVPLSTQKRKLQMTVQRNTEGVLVVQNSTLWLSAVFGVVGLVMIAAAFFSGDKRLAAPAWSWECSPCCA